MKKTIAIIDSTEGVNSSVLAHHLAKSGYPLLLSNNDSERFEDLKRSILELYPKASVEALVCAHECAWEADVLLLALCDQNATALIDKIKDVVTGKLVIQLMDENKNKCIGQLLPFSKVVQVFGDGVSSNKDTVIISGTDTLAIEQVTQLMNDIGISYRIVSPAKA